MGRRWNGYDELLRMGNQSSSTKEPEGGVTAKNKRDPRKFVPEKGEEAREKKRIRPRKGKRYVLK